MILVHLKSSCSNKGLKSECLSCWDTLHIFHSEQYNITDWNNGYLILLRFSSHFSFSSNESKAIQMRSVSNAGFLKNWFFISFSKRSKLPDRTPATSHYFGISPNINMYMHAIFEVNFTNTSRIIPLTGRLKYHKDVFENFQP